MECAAPCTRTSPSSNVGANSRPSAAKRDAGNQCNPSGCCQSVTGRVTAPQQRFIGAARNALRARFAMAAGFANEKGSHRRDECERQNESAEQRQHHCVTSHRANILPSHAFEGEQGSVDEQDDRLSERGRTRHFARSGSRSPETFDCAQVALQLAALLRQSTQRVFRSRRRRHRRSGRSRARRGSSGLH